LIGGFVFASSFTQNPFFKILFLNPGAFNVSQIHEKLDTDDKKSIFENLMKTSTQWLSVSFLVSAILKFGLSLYIFTPLAESLSVTEKQELTQSTTQPNDGDLISCHSRSDDDLCRFYSLFCFQKTTKITGLTMDQLFIK
jgi:hypothetical protein